MAPFGVTAITVLPLWVRPLAAVTLIRSVPELPRLTATVPSTRARVEVVRVPTVVGEPGLIVVPVVVVIPAAEPVPLRTPPVRAMGPTVVLLNTRFPAPALVSVPEPMTGAARVMSLTALPSLTVRVMPPAPMLSEPAPSIVCEPVVEALLEIELNDWLKPSLMLNRPLLPLASPRTRAVELTKALVAPAARVPLATVMLPWVLPVELTVQVPPSVLKMPAEPRFKLPVTSPVPLPRTKRPVDGDVDWLTLPEIVRSPAVDVSV